MPLETFTHPGIPIQSQADELEQLAIRAQKAWFAAPDSLEAKGEFAMRLRHWATWIKNGRALRHAAQLEAECAAAITA